MTEAEIVQKLSDIQQRIDASRADIPEDVKQKLFAEIRESLAGDPDFGRKIRFPGGDDARLVGSKYARLGLDVADLELLAGFLTAARGHVGPSGRVCEGPGDELLRTMRALSPASFLEQDKIRSMDARSLENYFSNLPSAWYADPQDRRLAAAGRWHDTTAYQTSMRAMDTAEAGFGAQLIGAQYVGALWGVARPMTRVFGLIRSFDMTDPTAYLPTEVDYPEPIFASESTANNSSNYGTKKTGSRRTQVDAKKFIIHQMWSGELDEDSIIPFLPFLRDQQAKSVANYSDSLAINGDTTNAGTGNINLDDADPDDTKYYLAFDGIRHLGLVDNTNNKAQLTGPITLAALNNARGRMIDTTNKIDWGHPDDPNDLVYVADPETADKIALLDEVVTVDKFGPQATILNGQAARVLGHPLIPSIWVSKTEADGKVSTTGSNNTKGQVVTFNRNGFVVGWRRRVKVEFERLPGSDQNRLVLSFRLGFGRHLTGADATTAEQADVIHDITL